MRSRPFSLSPSFGKSLLCSMFYKQTCDNGALFMMHWWWWWCNFPHNTSRAAKFWSVLMNTKPPCYRGQKLTFSFSEFREAFRRILFDRRRWRSSCSALRWSLNTLVASGDHNWLIFYIKRIWRPGKVEKSSGIAEDFIFTSRISIYLENHTRWFFQLKPEQMIDMWIVL